MFYVCKLKLKLILVTICMKMVGAKELEAGCTNSSYCLVYKLYNIWLRNGFQNCRSSIK